MNVEICIHGKPLAQSIYTTANERNNDLDYLCETFFKEYPDYKDQSLVAETKIWQNNIYCYYTYFRNSVKDKQGRFSYLGITLRTDSFISNLLIIYNILDIVYNQVVIGLVLNGDQKYIVDHIDGEGVGEKVSNIVVNLLSQLIQNRNVIKLDDTFLANSGSPLSYNPCDSSCLNLLTQYKSAEKIIISPSASLPRELTKAQEYQNKISYIKKESEERYLSQMNELRKKNDSLQSDVKRLSSKLHNKEEEGEVLKKEICILENELRESHCKVEQLNDQAELKKELVKISDPLLRLNGLLQRFGIVALPQQKNQAPVRRVDADIEKRKVEYPMSYKSSNRLKFFPIILIITSILLLGVLAFQIMLFSKYDNSNIVGTHMESITEVEEANKTKESEELSNAKEEDKVNRGGEEKTKELSQNFRIWIEGQNTYPDGLVAETGYHIGLVNKEGNYVDSLNNIKWDCLGGDIEPQIGNKVHLRTNKSGMIMITCFLPNGYTIKRKLKVYEKKTESQAPASYPNNMKKDEKSIPSLKKQGQASYGLKG